MSEALENSVTNLGFPKTLHAPENTESFNCRRGLTGIELDIYHGS